MITILKCFIWQEKGKRECWNLYLIQFRDGNIRYYELENDEFWPLAEYKSLDPQRGVAFMPKRALSVDNSIRYIRTNGKVHENEVMRAYKTVRDVLIEPVSFIVPRRVFIQPEVF